MLNRVILMGRLVADPELKTTGSGLSVTSFRIAVDRNYVKSGEERKADFIDIVCWRQTAEFVCRYFGKGSMIAVEGQLQTRTYQAKDGTNRYVVEVVADNVSFTGERRDNNGGGYNNGGYQQQYGGNSYSQQSYSAPAPQAPAYAPQQPQTSYQSGSNSDFQEMPLDDDLPF
ncbi:MAG: single-stranded DNA-binding protein [Ruminococcus sp.]|nr:single-stranded DNA-binding protein [Ruminococcus sp.]